MIPTTRNAAAAIGVFVLVAGLPGPVARAGGSASCYRLSAAETRMAELTNRSRAQNGLRPLVLDPELSRVAAKHAHVMAKKKRLFHTPDDLLAWRVTSWNALGENVGRGTSAGSLQAAFMASATHRANVLHSGFVHVGVGIEKRAGKIWTTVLFESKDDPGTRMRMPACG